MHEDLRELLGTYVLGQLDDPWRSDLEAHLATCDACRAELAELAPLVGPLASIDPDTLRPVGVTPSADLDRRIAQMLPPETTVTRLGAGRARRWALGVGAAVAGAAAATVVAISVGQDTAAPTQPVVVAVPDVTTAQGVSASAGVVDHTWGVEVKLQLDGLRPGERYDVRVVGDDGTSRDAGEILGVTDQTVTCNMSSSVLLSDASQFDVVDEAGRTVVSGPLGT